MHVNEAVRFHFSYVLTQGDMFKGAHFCKGHSVLREDMPIRQAVGRGEFDPLSPVSFSFLGSIQGCTAFFRGSIEANWQELP